jgi:acyl carrier protein
VQVLENSKEVLFGIIRNQLGMGDVSLDEDLFLIENLGFDSVQLISLIVDIEAAFQIEFSGSSLLFEKFNRIGDLLELIDEMRKKG